MENSTRILKLPAVLAHLQISRATLYRLGKDDARLTPFKLGERASGWEAEKIEAWLRERISAKPNDTAKATRAAKAVRAAGVAEVAA